MKELGSNLKIFLWLTCLTGIAYPMLITLVAQLTMKDKAGGQFVTYQGRTISSLLMGQKFAGDSYFWPRPSAVDYNPLASGGSNFGPTSAALKKRVDEQRSKIMTSHNVEANLVPSELLFTSGSGLDPHISLSCAHFQLDRILKARGLDPTTEKAAIETLLNNFTIPRRLYVLGEPCVNVLQLNLALDKTYKTDRGK